MKVGQEAIAVSTLVYLLIEKGIITREEWDRHLAAATAAGDQINAELRERGYRDQQRKYKFTDQQMALYRAMLGGD